MSRQVTYTLKMVKVKESLPTMPARFDGQDGAGRRTDRHPTVRKYSKLDNV